MRTSFIFFPGSHSPHQQNLLWIKQTEWDSPYLPGQRFSLGLGMSTYSARVIDSSYLVSIPNELEFPKTEGEKAGSRKMALINRWVHGIRRKDHSEVIALDRIYQSINDKIKAEFNKEELTFYSDNPHFNDPFSSLRPRQMKAYQIASADLISAFHQIILYGFSLGGYHALASLSMMDDMGRKQILCCILDRVTIDSYEYYSPTPKKFDAIPLVIITSKKDRLLEAEQHGIKLAHMIAKDRIERNINTPVYIFVLNDSPHVGQTKQDAKRYEQFMNSIYAKLGFTYDPSLECFSEQYLSEFDLLSEKNRELFEDNQKFSHGLSIPYKKKLLQSAQQKLNALDRRMLSVWQNKPVFSEGLFPKRKVFNNKSDQGWFFASKRLPSYVFMQDCRETQLQIASYLDCSTFITSTNESFRTSNYLLSIIPEAGLHLESELDEVVLDQLSYVDRLNQTMAHAGLKIQKFLNDVYLFFLMKCLRKKFFEIEPDIIFYERSKLNPISEPSLLTPTYDKCATDFSQSKDIAQHLKKMPHLILNQSVILFGIGRGATTSFIAVAKHHNMQVYQKVCMCILENPLSSFARMYKHHYGHTRGMESYAQRFGSGHDPRRDQAVHYVERFPKNIPCVVISTPDHAVVPQQSSVHLAMRLALSRRRAKVSKQDNIAPVYCIVLATGSQGDESIRYRYLVHSAYKKHGLSYCPKFVSNSSMEELEQYNLLSEDFNEQFQFQQDFYHQKTARHEQRAKAQRNYTSLKPSQQSLVSFFSLHHKKLPVYDKTYRLYH